MELRIKEQIGNYDEKVYMMKYNELKIKHERIE